MTSCREKWCGYCYAGRKGRCFYKGHWGWRAAARPSHRRVRSVRKPSKPDNGAGSQMARVEATLFSTEFSTLTEWLVENVWEDGTTRETSTLLVFMEEGRWKGCLHDRDGHRSVFLTAGSPEDLFKALDEGLREDSLDWRAKAPRAPSTKNSGR